MSASAETLEPLQSFINPAAKARSFIEQRLQTIVMPMVEFLPERKRLNRAATAFLCAAAMWGAVQPATAEAQTLSGTLPAAAKTESGVSGGEVIVPAPAAVPMSNEECGDPDNRASKQALIDSILCRFNNARAVPLVEDPELEAAAEEKIEDEIRCRHSSHLPCPEDTDIFERTEENKDLSLTPTWAIGENLAYGLGVFGKARSIFGGWWQSRSHRLNIVNGGFTNVGIAVKHVRRIVMDVDLENGLTIKNMLLRNVNFFAAEFWGPGKR